jgi:hypothetical protein
MSLLQQNSYIQIYQSYVENAGKVSYVTNSTSLLEASSFSILVLLILQVIAFSDFL